MGDTYGLGLADGDADDASDGLEAELGHGLARLLLAAGVLASTLLSLSASDGGGGLRGALELGDLIVALLTLGHGDLLLRLKLSLGHLQRFCVICRYEKI